ncbi:MAG: hypothetical protein KBT46_08670 [Ruminococcus sp.]|nr:hypothetical protein [Candidatus Copronaster equi]
MRKKIIAIVLAAAMAFSLSFQAFAEEGTGKAYSPFAHAIDHIFGELHDGLFGFLMNLTAEKDIPEYEDYAKEQHANFYEGTDGAKTGINWSAGFANGSIVPTAWRTNADGKADPQGMNLKSIKATGGYQTYVKRMYTDQMLNMVILSNGTDSNHNGVKDIIIFADADGVGITAGSCREMRANIESALATYGVTADDILGINISASHCHAGLDIQGMCIPTLFLNKLNPFTDYNRSLPEEMEKTLCTQAYNCAKEAYGKIEAGVLYFFETGKVSGASDKLNSGVQPKNYFSCFLFEGISGEKTILSNIGAHPTSYGAWDSNKMMCTDYPYFMGLALRDAGYNLVFTQSSQAAISSPSIDYEEGSALDVAATKWVASKALTKEQWTERYGEKYTKKWYDKLEESMEGHMKKGYTLAHFIIDASANKKLVAPVLNVKNSETLISLDYGVMAWGSVSGLLGEYAVKTDKSETGYGVVVETNYIEIGKDVAILTAPGELSPALTYGSDPTYTGTAFWNGKTSWTGEEWKYDTLENIVRDATGDSDKTVLFYGITNDALGYMFPDINVTESLLGTLLFYKEAPDDMTNSMLMTVGSNVGHELVESYTALVKSVK